MKGKVWLPWMSASQIQYHIGLLLLLFSSDGSEGQPVRRNPFFSFVAKHWEGKHILLKAPKFSFLLGAPAFSTFYLQCIPKSSNRIIFLKHHFGVLPWPVQKCIQSLTTVSQIQHKLLPKSYPTVWTLHHSNSAWC